MAGCDVVAKYNSADVHIAPAEKTGQVTVFHDCIVREVLVSNENRATGVRYLHRVHQREGEVRGRTVVVACACVQSVALLLMSTSARYPTGLANSSGQLGRHFIPHFTGGIECVLEGPARQAADQRRGVSRSRLSAVVRAPEQEARLCPQLRRAVQLPEPPVRGMGEDAAGGFGRAYKASVKAAYPAYPPLHALRRDAAERAVVRRSRSASARTRSACRWRGATCVGATTKKRCSTTWFAGACRCSRRPARKS